MRPAAAGVCGLNKPPADKARDYILVKPYWRNLSSVALDIGRPESAAPTSLEPGAAVRRVSRSALRSPAAG